MFAAAVSYANGATDLSSQDGVDYYEFVSFDQEPLQTPPEEYQSICTHLPAWRGDILQVAQCLAHLGAACRVVTDPSNLLSDASRASPACTFELGVKEVQTFESQKPDDKSRWIRHIGEKLTTTTHLTYSENLGQVSTAAECATRCHQRTTRCRSFNLNINKDPVTGEVASYGCTAWSLRLGDASVVFEADENVEYWEFTSYEQLPYGQDPVVAASENGIQCTHRAPWNADILTVA